MERKLSVRARVDARPARRTRAAGALALACVALAACSAALAAPAASAAAPGGVAGLVQAATTEAPIAGIEVCARSVAEPLGPKLCATTSAAGEYEIAGLAEGQYIVSFSAPASSGLNYLTQYFAARSTEALADPVTVTEATTTQEVNATMQPGGEIKGSVSEGKGNPLAGIEVCALEKGVEAPARCVFTKASGNYAIAGLASGEYEIEFSSPAGFEHSYVTQFYDGVASRAAATALAVTAGAVAVKGVNAVLEPVPPPTGAITGTVTSAATKAPLPGVEACARNAAMEVERCTVTDAGGAYTLAALPTGAYIVRFIPATAGASYALQFFDNKASEAEAESVTVTAEATVTGIDAVLQGIPVAVLRPAIVGRAAEGQTLTLVTGTWSNEPALSDEWGQCDATGAIESCHTIAMTPTYTPTAADVGCTIRVRERASNEFGAGTPPYLFSPPTAPVTTASGGTGSCRPVATAAPAWSPPAPTSAVSAATTASASSAQLKALLAKLLVPSGKRAKIAALRKRGRYVFTFSSLVAGRISIAWYLVPKGARTSAARPKPVLVGSGKLMTKASGPENLTIKLTAAGRALLAKRKSLKLTAKGAFAPKGRPTLRATRNFTLRR